MSAKRKLIRAARARGAENRRKPEPRATGSARDLLETERFRVQGADKLWLALLGWDPARRNRMWFVQAVHDGARRKRAGDFAPESVAAQLARRAPAAAGALEPDAAETAVDLWKTIDPGEDFESAAPLWQYLANAGTRLGLGEGTAEELARDWEIWARLELASEPRTALMASLAQAEQHAMALRQVTESEPVESTAQVLRVLWTALAYGDEDTFRRLTDFANDWLSRAHQK